MDSGFSPPSRASTDIPGGTKLHNNMERVESISLGYTSLSAINLKATTNGSNLTSDQAGSHPSYLYPDLRLQVNENVHPVSGLNELNQTLRAASSLRKGRRDGSQDGGPHVGDTDSDRQTLGPRHPVVSHDSLTEGLKIGKGDIFSGSFSNNPRYLHNFQGELEALNVKFEEASQAAANKVCSYSNTKSLEEIQSLIKNEFWNIFNRDGTRKRSSTDASLTEPASSKRKTVACEFCPKKMLRECDLKYKASLRNVVRSAKGMTESIKNVTPVPTAAPLKPVSRLLVARVTGNDTKKRSITMSKHGGVMNIAPIRSNSVPRSFTGESNSKLISKMGIKSSTKIISVSSSSDSRSGRTGRRDSGVGFVRRLSS